MNARALNLVASLRGVLGTVPGANEISLHDFESGWTLVRIVAGPLHDERLSFGKEGERAMTPAVPRSPR